MVAHMQPILLKGDDTAAVWDVSEVVAQKSLWADYFKPTVTRGNIQRTAKIHGFLGVSQPDVLMFQHNCMIMHGNSGGPLFNGGGQVIAVVGRGASNVTMGDHELVWWATAAGELKEWLEAHKVAFAPAGEWRKPPQSVKIIERQRTTI